MNSQDEGLIWPLVIIVVAFFLYKMSQNSAAQAIAVAQANANAAAAANNNPWLGVSAGVGAASSILGSFANLFESSD